MIERPKEFILCGLCVPNNFLLGEMLLQVASSGEPPLEEADELDDTFILKRARTRVQFRGTVSTYLKHIWDSLDYCLVQLTGFKDSRWLSSQCSKWPHKAPLWRAFLSAAGAF